MAKDFIFPDLGEGITEGELVRWLVKVGDEVEEDQEVAEVETDKALVTIPSPQAGKIVKLNYQAGESIPVGSVLLSYEDNASSEKSPPPEKTKAPEAATSKPTSREEKTPASSEKLPPLATPSTRQLARELEVDIGQIQGSGPSGRITEDDVRQAAKTPATKQASPKSSEVKSTPQEKPKESVSNTNPSSTARVEDIEGLGPVERIPLKGVRRKISEHMMRAAQNTVMVTHMDEAKVDTLLKIRERQSEFLKEKNIKLTLLPFVIKACAIAIKNYPYLNASLDGDEILLKKYYHFGFAVDTEVGLMVPVLRNVDKKSILHLATELTELSQKARERRVNLEELQGHSFSVTNIGNIGGKAFTPILHYPDTSILGLGKAYAKPVVENNQIVIANVLPLALTFDHRVADGATAARFVNEVIRYLENPDLFLLEDGEQ